jgi:ribonuclease HII
MPDWSFEDACAAPVAGVDEVGRGCLAGNVVAAAVIFPSRQLSPLLASGIQDSKTMTIVSRESLAAEIQLTAHWAIGESTPAEIDRMNILQASLLAMHRAITALPIRPAAVLVDGKYVPAGLSCPATPVVRGDSHSYSIAAASILAKVWRDRQMQALHHDYPGYGWEQNMGYPTATHREALKKWGVTPHHRRSFAPVRMLCGAHEP